MKNESVKFKFDGNNFQNNEFEIKELGQIFESIGNIFEYTNRSLSSDSSLNVKVNSKFNPGSFEFVTKIYQFIDSTAVPVLSGIGVTSILNLHTLINILFSNNGSLFELLKFLKGAPPKEIKKSDESSLIFRNDGQVLEVKNEALKLFDDNSVRKAIGIAIANSLSKDGTDNLEISTKDFKTRINKKESYAFGYQQKNDEYEDIETMETELEIVSISFDPEKKWQFRNNKHTFLAEIDSEKFKERVEAGEVFKKGDRLRTVLQTEMFISNQRILKKRKIIDVLDHITLPVQNELFD